MDTVALYLAAVVGGGLLARLLRLPTLVGYLAAGFVLHALRAPELAAVDILADAGVTVLLFTIGLKLDLRTLFRREVVVTAGLNLVALVGLTTGALGLLAAMGPALLDGVDAGALALLGFSLSFSSTVFVVTILDERSESHSLYGRIAIGVLVFQDVVAVTYLTIASGHPPDWTVLVLLALPVPVWLARRVWGRIGHDELLVLFGVFMALVPGHLLFHSVGVEGDFGALVVGMMLASHPRAPELSHSLFGLRDLLLVCFFVQIGLESDPTWQSVGVGLVLLVLLPVEAMVFTLILSSFRMRHRTSVLAGLALANFSEFGLIVVDDIVSTDRLPHDWLAVVSVAVAGSFVFSTLVNRRGTRLVTVLSRYLPTRAADRMHPEDQPIDLSGAQAVVLGVGRVGRSAQLRLRERYGLRVVGVENDPLKVEALRTEGLEVIEADATENDFWDRARTSPDLVALVLAMPFHGANLLALERLTRERVGGTVAAVVQYDDDGGEILARGADVAFQMYEGAGMGLADRAAQAAGLER